MQEWQAIVASIFGGGGIIAAIIKLVDLKNAAQNNELVREDTEIGRWRTHLELETKRRKDAEGGESRALQREAWYRQYYYLARDRLPLEDRKDFPLNPPMDLH